MPENKPLNPKKGRGAGRLLIAKQGEASQISLIPCAAPFHRHCAAACNRASADFGVRCLLFADGYSLFPVSSPSGDGAEDE